MIQAASKVENYHKLEIGDMSNLSYPDGFFDVVYVSRFFMLFEDVKPFLNQIARVLQPDGLLIFDNIRRSIHNLINATVGTAEGWNHPRKTHVMQKILQDAGFRVLERRSAFLASTGIMNRMPPFLFKFFSAMEQVFPERCRVMEFYKATKAVSKIE
jgi:ubiquinone/menaquinone biosynthesis C-methylase UbiE